jgi:hypothetical protein
VAQLQHGAPRRRGGAHRLRFVLIAAGIAVLVSAGLIWAHSRPAPNVGAAQVTKLATAAPSPTTEVSPDSVGPQVPVQPGSLPTRSPDVVVPVKVQIPKFGVSATVTPVGLDGADDVVIPTDVKTVGWYEYGPGLNATSGSMVVAGHVDNLAQGDGAFFRLRDLTVGDTFTITGSDGRIRTFRVIAREEYPKATIQLGRYFATTGDYRVTLMTCGGSFNTSTRHYEDNVAVTAVPA